MDENYIDDLDLLFIKAAQNVVRYQRASVEFLQERLRVGSRRASQIINQLESVKPGTTVYPESQKWLQSARKKQQEWQKN